MCELCNLEKKTKWYFEDTNWIICDCLTCKMPMAVYKKHTLVVPGEHMMDIFHAISIVWDNVRADKFEFRFEQRKVKDHFHFHIKKRGNNG